MSTEGVNILPGSTVNAVYSFNNCTFRNGQSGGRLMTINNNQTFNVNDAIFPMNATGSSYNVYKSVNSGTVNFIDATGAFAGEKVTIMILTTELIGTLLQFTLNLTVFMEGPYDPSTPK
ncbi:MAG: hypothetical protein R2764_02780 [Bacteroidales bacterium]